MKKYFLIFLSVSIVFSVLLIMIFSRNLHPVNTSINPNTSSEDQSGKQTLLFYTDRQHNFEFSYPSSWKLESNSQEVVTLEKEAQGKIVFDLTNPHKAYQPFEKWFEQTNKKILNEKDKPSYSQTLTKTDNDNLITNISEPFVLSNEFFGQYGSIYLFENSGKIWTIETSIFYVDGHENIEAEDEIKQILSSLTIKQNLLSYTDRQHNFEFSYSNTYQLDDKSSDNSTLITLNNPIPSNKLTTSPDITIRSIDPGKSSFQAILNDTVYDPSGMHPNSIDNYTKIDIDGYIYYFIKTGQFEGVSSASFYKLDDHQILVFSLISSPIDWTDPNYKIENDQVYKDLYQILTSFKFTYGKNATSDTCSYQSISISLSDAKKIADQYCGKDGKVGETGQCNDYTGTWWLEFTPNTPNKLCNPACVVDLKTNAAEINWRCTGALVE